MCKKVLIAALAVVVGLAVVKGTWLGSHLRLRWKEAREAARASVPPEQEIARLRMELGNLAREDDKHFDKVARMWASVEKMDREVNEIKTRRSREEARLKKLRGDLKDTEFVLYQGSKYTMDDLRADALAFQQAEESYKSKEANLQARKKHLNLEKKKLSELRLTREKMATDLQRLETALAEERHAPAASESCIDDSGYLRLRKDMESLKEGLDVLKKARQLKGELRIDTVSEEAKKQNEQADKYIDARFGETKKDAAVADSGK